MKNKSILTALALGALCGVATQGASGAASSGADTLIVAGQVMGLMPVTENIIAQPSDTVLLAADTVAVDTVAVDSVAALAPTVQRVMARINSSEHAAEYRAGIIPHIARHSADYAWRLLDNGSEGFLMVDKGAMTVTLFDRYGAVQKRFPIACARNYGDKRRSGDNRTPEGFFSVQGVYNSTGWLYHGAPHQFGPRFIRIKTPVTMSVGIHGTAAPGSIGGRRSHGCIRTLNKNILELAPLVKAGMPVIIVAGPRDVQVNRSEGRSTVWVPRTPTSAKPDGSSAKKTGIKKTGARKARR